MLGNVLRLFIDKQISLIASSGFFILQSENRAIRKRRLGESKGAKGKKKKRTEVVAISTLKYLR